MMPEDPIPDVERLRLLVRMFREERVSRFRLGALELDLELGDSAAPVPGPRPWPAPGDPPDWSDGPDIDPAAERLALRRELFRGSDLDEEA